MLAMLGKEPLNTKGMMPQTKTDHYLHNIRTNRCICS